MLSVDSRRPGILFAVAGKIVSALTLQSTGGVYRFEQVTRLPLVQT
jgi:hypothetical protein